MLDAVRASLLLIWNTLADHANASMRIYRYRFFAMIGPTRDSTAHGTARVPPTGGSGRAARSLGRAKHGRVRLDGNGSHARGSGRLNWLDGRTTGAARVGRPGGAAWSGSGSTAAWLGWTRLGGHGTDGRGLDGYERARLGHLCAPPDRGGGGVRASECRPLAMRRDAWPAAEAKRTHPTPALHTVTALRGTSHTIVRISTRTHQNS